jgi:hypothetical protein
MRRYAFGLPGLSKPPGSPGVGCERGAPPPAASAATIARGISCIVMQCCIMHLYHVDPGTR